jgi:hypothetical protein
VLSYIYYYKYNILTAFTVTDIDEGIKKPRLGEKKSCKSCGHEGVNKQCRSVLCKKCYIASYQKCGVSDHDTSRLTAAKPYLDTLAHSPALSNEETNDNDGEGDAVVSFATAAANFEHVKATLEAAISENHSVFIFYLVEKKPASEEGGKKKGRTACARRYL